MNAKHTPGPWLRHGRHQDEVWNAGGDVMVAHCHHDPSARPDTEAEGFANAKLIAAAPALADALETFIRDFDVSLDAFEREAEDFRRETGFLAPGKDEAAAVNSGHTHEQRRAAWNEWCGKRVRARLEAARAALRAAGRLP